MALKQMHAIFQLSRLPDFVGAVAMARREMKRKMDYNTYTMAMPLDLLEQCPDSEEAVSAVKDGKVVSQSEYDEMKADTRAQVGTRIRA